MGIRRHRANVSISLFSFQDIITCLSGIMILLVLLISLDIVTQNLSGDADLTGKSVSTNPSSEQSSPDMNAHQNPNEKKATTTLEQRHLDLQNIKTAILEREKELTSRVAELEEKYNILSRNNTITLIPEKGSRQAPLLVECSGDNIRVGEFDADVEKRSDRFSSSSEINFSTDGNGINKFLSSLAGINKSDEYLLFMIKPSASDYVMQLIRQVQSMDFDVGYDAMLEDQTLSFDR